MFQKYVPDIQDALPLAPADRPSKRGLETPMEVMDAPYRAGDLTPRLSGGGRQSAQRSARARREGQQENLLQELHGRARELRNSSGGATSDAAGAGGKGFGRRISAGHDDARDFARTGPGVRARTCLARWTFAKRSGRLTRGLEEAKADVVGMFGLKWLVDHGALPKEKLEEYYASYVAGIFRTVRFGAGEAHGQRGDDGVQLSFGTGSDQARSLRTICDRLRPTCRRRWPTWQKNCWKSKPQATANARRTGSRNMT